MTLCGNRSPITGECILGCPGMGGCRRGTEQPSPSHYDMLAELNRVKVLFQSRAIETHLTGQFSTIGAQPPETMP